MTQKAFFFDLDGTLAINDQPPSLVDQEAIRTLRGQGHLAFLCTGRAPCHVYKAITNIGFDGIIAGAGTHVSIGDQVIYRHTLEPALMHRILTYFLTSKERCVLEGEQSLYAINPRPGSWENRWLRIDDADAFTPGVGVFAGQEILKFTALEDSREQTRRAFQQELYMIDHGKSLEFVPVGINKAEGMRRVLEAVGIDRANSVAFGDSRNDLDMLQYAGIGVAMGTAPDDVRQVANMITAPLAENGVAQGIARVMVSV